MGSLASFFTTTGAMYSAPGSVWPSASGAEDPAAFSASSGILTGLALFELRLRLRRFIANTILAQRVQTGLSIAPANASNSKEGKIFSTHRIERVSGHTQPHLPV